MGMWYPNNTKRHDRAQQLITQTNDFQASVRDASKTQDNLRADIQEDVDAGLKIRGYTTITAMMTAYQKDWSEKDKKHYEDMVTQFANVEENLATEIKIMGYVASAAGVVGGVAKAGLLLEHGKIAAGFRCLGEGLLRLINKETEAATRLLKTAVTAIQETVKILEIPEAAAKILNAIKFIAKVVGAIAIVLDGILIGFDLYEEHKQKVELEDAIKDLNVKRFVACLVGDLYSAYRVYMGHIYSITSDLAESKKPDDRTQQRIKKDIDRMTKGAKAVTFDTVWKKLQDKDVGAYTDADYKKEELAKIISKDSRFEFKFTDPKH
ncbi:hypothetical protein BDV38DRAFT_244018 [Aspergillus pseudotamarii]|uniref:Uncharacterized protein n=1 Tax=Aspergillus pseudotamarii TaxID=132259 RepID=A0A5N6SZI1_ASPPS|nr:uncharacterized protein BDV38DRAFT_244018 [Aspergillus pseudotamarii]KAE8138843.1 hypothetical protein BDV38DRAFT_244018 [Aspergillus pseudotamarii]